MSDRRDGGQCHWVQIAGTWRSTVGHGDGPTQPGRWPSSQPSAVPVFWKKKRVKLPAVSVVVEEGRTQLDAVRAPHPPVGIASQGLSVSTPASCRDGTTADTPKVREVPSDFCSFSGTADAHIHRGVAGASV